MDALSMLIESVRVVRKFYHYHIFKDSHRFKGFISSFGATYDILTHDVFVL